MGIIRRVFESIRNYFYYWSYYHHDINSNSVIIECHCSHGISNTIVELLKHISKRWNKQIYLAVEKNRLNEIESELTARGIKGVKVLRIGSFHYSKLLETSQFIVNDYIFPDWYIKRKGQVYVSFLSCTSATNIMECNDEQFKERDMIQRNLLLTDILCGTSKGSLEYLLNSYGVANLFHGTFVLLTKPIDDNPPLSKPSVQKNEVDNLLYQMDCSSADKTLKNSTDKVLVYGGDLGKNGITTSLENLLAAVDDGREYYVLYRRNQLIKKRHNLSNLINANYIGISGEPFLTPLEILCSLAFVKLNLRNSIIEFYYYRMISREYQRVSINGLFDFFIHFSGYESYVISLFQEANGNRSIFVHSNMPREIQAKSNQSINVLHDAYTRYDHVAVVSEALIEPTKSIGDNSSPICLVENLIDDRYLLEKAKEDITIQDHTELNLENVKHLESLLHTSKVVIITIGRFSEEKQHGMLIDAFERFADIYLNTLLVIIGGYGRLYHETLARAQRSRHSKKIVIIKDIENPMPILGQSSLFVLSSSYEGKPVVFYEAAALHIPVIGTRAPGISEFLEEYNGYISDNSSEGLYNAFIEFTEGKVHPLQIDFNNLVNVRLNQFEGLLEAKQ